MVSSMVRAVSFGLIVPFLSALIEMIVGVIICVALTGLWELESWGRNIAMTATPLIVLGCCFSSFVGLVWGLRFGAESGRPVADRNRVAHIYAKISPGLGVLVLSAAIAGTAWDLMTSERWELRDFSIVTGVAVAAASVMITTGLGWSFRLLATARDG